MRRGHSEIGRRPASIAAAAAIQIFLSRLDTFVGTELFAADEPITIGRHRDSTLRLQGDAISRFHCRIVLDAGQLYLEDLGSANGTLLNRCRIASRVALKPGDAIHIGPFAIKVRALLPMAAEPRASSGISEQPTRVEAVLSAENSGASEAAIDLGEIFDRRLYDDAMRRATGVTPAASPSPLAEQAIAAPVSAPMAGADSLPITPIASAPAASAPLANALAQPAAPSTTRPDEIRPPLETAAVMRGPESTFPDAEWSREPSARIRAEAEVDRTDSTTEPPIPDQGSEAETPAVRSQVVIGARIEPELARKISTDGHRRLSVLTPPPPQGDSSADVELQPTRRDIEVTPEPRVARQPEIDRRAQARMAELDRLMDAIGPSSSLGAQPVDPAETPSRLSLVPAAVRRAEAGSSITIEEDAAEWISPSELDRPASLSDGAIDSALERFLEAELGDVAAGDSVPFPHRDRAARKRSSRFEVVPAEDMSHPESDALGRAPSVIESDHPSAPPVHDVSADAARAMLAASAQLPSPYPPPPLRRLSAVQMPTSANLEAMIARAQADTNLERPLAPAGRTRTLPPPLPPSSAKAKTPAPLAPSVLAELGAEPGADEPQSAVALPPSNGQRPRLERIPSIVIALRDGRTGRSGRDDRSGHEAPSLRAPATGPILASGSYRARPLFEAQLVTPTGLKVAISPLVAKSASHAPRSPSGEDVTLKVGVANEGLVRDRTSPPVRKQPPPMPRRPSDTMEAGFEAVEIAARSLGRLLDIAILRRESEQYVLGHRTPQGKIVPHRLHPGLRLIRITENRQVDLVFPRDVTGNLIRDDERVVLRELTMGRKYSCLRLKPQDLATVTLGEGPDAISYHIRFIRRPKAVHAAGSA